MFDEYDLATLPFIFIGILLAILYWLVEKNCNENSKWHKMCKIFIFISILLVVLGFIIVMYYITQ